LGNQESGYSINYLKKLINHYKFSPSSLSKISGIPEESILNCVDDVSSLHDTRWNLDIFVMLLTESMEAHNEDERVQLLISNMMQEFDISFETIGIYAKIPPEKIVSFLEEANSLSIETRYRLGVTVLFLHFICYTKYRLNFDA
jgi:hypothetical protein